MITERKLICITCPIGCEMNVTLKGKDVLSVAGNTCKRGEAYAIAECTNPVRTITTIMRTKGGKIISVKTDKPVLKELMSDCMKIIKSTLAEDNVKPLDTVIENILQTGANVTVTRV